MCRTIVLAHVLEAIKEKGYDPRCAEVEGPEYPLPPYDEHEVLSPCSLYHSSSGGRDNGAMLDDALIFARDCGVAREVT